MFAIVLAFAVLRSHTTKNMQTKSGAKMRKTSAKSENLKDEICKVALRLFSEKGYDAANMSEIADILGITRTPLYYYYSDKKCLYVEAIKKHLETKRNIYTNMAAETSNIFDWLRRHVEFACSNKSDIVLFNVFDRPEFEFLSDLNDETCRYVYALKRRRVQRAVETGELAADIDIDLFLSNVYVMSYGFIYVINESILSQDLQSNPQKVTALIDLFIAEVKCIYAK